MQEVKRTYIDGYCNDAFKSDEYNNKSYKNIIFEKNSVIGEFSFYVYACEQKKIYLLEYPKQPFKFQINKKTEFFTENSSFFTDSLNIPYLFKTSIKQCSDFYVNKYNNTPSNNEISELSKQNTTISINTAMALNNYLEFINQAIRNTSYSADYFRSFNRNVNNYVNQDYSKFSFRMNSNLKINLKNKLVRSFYEKAIVNSRYVPEIYREALNLQTNALFDIYTESRQLVEKTNKYIEAETYIKDSFALAIEYTKQ